MKQLEGLIFYELDKAIKTYRQFAQGMLTEAKLDITVDQWLVMNILNEHPGITQQEIAEKVFKDNASVTRIIELLVNKLYLKRTASDDRRRSVLSITAKGDKLLSQASKIVQSYRRKALKGISESALNHTKKTLNTIIKNCH
jgi:MarR family transcriptional regulator, transcriptional regulator for hemolysin